MQRQLPTSICSFIWHFLMPYKLYAFGLIIAAMISGLYGVISSKLIKIIVDLLEKTTNPDQIIGLIIWPAIFFVINFEIHNLTWRAIAAINYKIQPLAKNNIINQVFAYVSRHSYQFFQDNLAGRISTNISMLANNMELIIHDFSAHLIRGAVLLLASLITMYFVNPIFCYGLLTWDICF